LAICERVPLSKAARSKFTPPIVAIFGASVNDIRSTQHL